MCQNPNRGKTGDVRSPQIVRAEQLHRWGELLLRWGWFIFEVVKWASG